MVYSGCVLCKCVPNKFNSLNLFYYTHLKSLNLLFKYPGASLWSPKLHLLMCSKFDSQKLTSRRVISAVEQSIDNMNRTRARCRHNGSTDGKLFRWWSHGWNLFIGSVKQSRSMKMCLHSTTSPTIFLRAFSGACKSIFSLKNRWRLAKMWNNAKASHCLTASGNKAKLSTMKGNLIIPTWRKKWIEPKSIPLQNYRKIKISIQFFSK